ncbi:hypothetical protein N665_3105s0001 [Sinapis alba]|nr:hypothetical protein N665_3105s0001 [Sinapis alba]
MSPKKKNRNALRGSTKMARLQGVSKSTATLKSLQELKSEKELSPLAGMVSAVAAIATVVVEETSPSLKTSDGGLEFHEGSVLACSDPNNSSTRVVAVDEEVSTPTVGEEVKPGGIPVSPVAVETGAPAANTVVTQATGMKNYASLLKESAQLEELGTPSEHVTGVPFVLIPDENIEAAKEEFKEFIYARFHGEYPSMGRIIGVVNAIWAKAGPRIFVHNIGEGAYLLRVTNTKTRDMLLARTCWNIAGLPMFVAPWSPEFTPEEAPIQSAVVPVELRNVPYLLFNKESLSRLATAVGKPVSLAPETERKENFQVAKMYVRVDLTKPLPRKIISGFSNGKEQEIAVNYPWLPLKCEVCAKYGHLREKCRVQGAGPASQRKRSKSPFGAANKGRNKSRQGRVKAADMRSSGDHDSSRPTENNLPLEEGEIPQPDLSAGKGEEDRKSQVISQTRNDESRVSGQDDVGNVPNASNGSIVAANPPDTEPGDLQKQRTVSQTSSQFVETRDHTSRTVDDAPFFLVNRGKSGRKVITPQ